MEKMHFFIGPPLLRTGKKMLMLMKFTAFFILVASLQVSAKTFSQETISVDFKKTILADALKEVEKKSEYRFVFSNLVLSDGIRVTIAAKDITVNSLLKQILTPAGLSYHEIGDKLVAIKKSEDSPAFVSISGKVLDEKGEPLSGVSITVKGTNKGTSSDINGAFSIDARQGDVLEFSMVGYKPYTVTLTNQTTFSITMQLEATQLTDVVVVGFGSQKKANLTGSVTSIDAKALEARPVQNVGQALQGLMPGLNFQTSGLGGELNQTLSFNIRGGGTIGSGSNSAPLVLVDGMEANLNAINPQDIESVTVLKDAAASAIYGSRAPFGVILITTKKGKSGKATVNYNNNFRWNKPIGLPTMMDAHTFALYWNEAAINGGEAAKFGQEVLDRIVQFKNGEIDYGTVPDATGLRYQYYTGSNANTDWFKEMYRPAAFAHDHAISVNGGTENMNYYLSANYLDQTGLNRYANDGFNRYTVTAKINTRISNYIKFNYTTRYIREDFGKAIHMNDLYYHNIARRWPTVPAKDPNGHWTDPSEIAQLEQGGRYKDQNDWLYVQGQLVITPAKGWNIFADGNFRTTNRNIHEDVLPAYSYDVAGQPYALAVGYNNAGFSRVYEKAQKDNFFNTNIYSDFEYKLNNAHYFKIMGGFNAELNKYRTLAGSRTNLYSYELPTLNTSDPNILSRANEGQYQHWATAGFFGRFNYNYKEKYLLEVNARYDGTSRFMRDQRWNLFPSVSAGWNIAKEGFWKLDHIVQMLKLRASYGELGNQNTSNWYPFYSLIPGLNTNGSWLVNGQQLNAPGQPPLVSSFLTWERVTNWNVGFDMAVLKNRLNINFDYFNRKTFDMVGPGIELPVVLGIGVPNVNNADMESKGFELEAKWQDRIGKFGYSIRGVLSDDQQVVTKYINPTGNLNNWYNGRKWGEIWGYTTIGIAKTDEEMAAYTSKVSQNAMGSTIWEAGDIMYKDLNGDGKVDGGANTMADPGDRSIIGNSSPRYRYSLDLGADWNGFDLRIYLQGVAKRDYMPNGPYFWGINGGMWQSAGFTEHMDFFRDENSEMVKAGVAGVNLDAYYPKPNFANGGKNQQTQTRYLQNAAYMRLKNLQIGYTIPQIITSRVGISRLRVYLSGENLVTFTRLSKIFDPETVALSGWNDGKTYPLAKVYSAGLSINF
jgi:TonB-linked SusC/RagA family outer membrane protein